MQEGLDLINSRRPGLIASIKEEFAEIYALVKSKKDFPCVNKYDVLKAGCSITLSNISPLIIHTKSWNVIGLLKETFPHLIFLVVKDMPDHYLVLMKQSMIEKYNEDLDNFHEYVRSFCFNELNRILKNEDVSFGNQKSIHCKSYGSYVWLELNEIQKTILGETSMFALSETESPKTEEEQLYKRILENKEALIRLCELNERANL
jgi:hypothetical protein